jgi:hypothetical protein
MAALLGRSRGGAHEASPPPAERPADRRCDRDAARRHDRHDVLDPRCPDLTAPPTERPLGRYPTTAEAGVVTSCVSGIDPNTVPGPIAQAFCVCTLNKYEQLYPTYEEFQRAQTSGAITKQITTDISNRCAQQIVGG